MGLRPIWEMKSVLRTGEIRFADEIRLRRMKSPLCGGCGVPAARLYLRLRRGEDADCHGPGGASQ